MTKREASRIFGKTQNDLAFALGRSAAAVSQWGEHLTRDQMRLVLGEARLQGKRISSKIDLTERVPHRKDNKTINKELLL
jgi:hypothetical protein